MKNKKIWRMIKKILRTICIWGIISMMMVSVSADVVGDIGKNPDLVCTAVYQIGTSPLRIIDYSKNPDTNGYLQLSNYLAGNTLMATFIAKWYSMIYSNTIYYIEIDYEGTFNTEKTGEIIKDDNNGISICSDDAWEIHKLPEDYYSGFVDKTAKKIYYIFYVPESWFESHPECRQHAYVQIMTDKYSAGETKVKIKKEVYTEVRTPYTDILKDISAKLDLVGGGGMTKEELQEAVQEALEEHQRQEQIEAQQGTQDAQQQAEQAMARYTAVMEQMKTAMAGIEDIKNIDTSTYTLTIGPFYNPMTGGTFPAVGVDFYTAYQSIPAVLKSTCPIVVTFFVLMAYAREFLDIFRHVEKTMHGEDE